MEVHHRHYEAFLSPVAQRRQKLAPHVSAANKYALRNRVPQGRHKRHAYENNGVLLYTN